MNIEISLVPLIREKGAKDRKVVFSVADDVSLVNQDGTVVVQVSPTGRVFSRLDEIELFDTHELEYGTEVKEGVPFQTVCVTVGTRVAMLFRSRGNHLVYDHRPYSVASIENRVVKSKKK